MMTREQAWRRVLLDRFEYPETEEGFEYLMRDSGVLAESFQDPKVIAAKLIDVALVDGDSFPTEVKAMAVNLLGAVRELETADA